MIYEGVKIAITEVYYGDKRRPKNPFRNCKSPKDIFNLSRRISLEINTKLKRIGVVCTESGEVLLKGEQHKILDINALPDFDSTATISESSPQAAKAKTTEQTSQTTAISKDQANPDLERYYKRELFLPLPTMLSSLSLQAMQFEGVAVPALAQIKLYTRRGVWPPTFDRVYSLFLSYLQERAHFLKEVEGVLEIGTGTGVLAFLLSKFLAKTQTIHALDINPEAVKTVVMNANILNLQDKVKPIQADLLHLAALDPTEQNRFLKSFG